MVIKNAFFCVSVAADEVIEFFEQYAAHSVAYLVNTSMPSIERPFVPTTRMVSSKVKMLLSEQVIATEEPVVCLLTADVKVVLIGRVPVEYYFTTNEPLPLFLA